MPSCPSNYSCVFTLVRPKTSTHLYGPWYDSPLGIVLIAVVALVALALLTWAITALFGERRRRAKEAAAAKERELERKHQLALEEQRTYQLDMAKGDHELLKLAKGL